VEALERRDERLLDDVFDRMIITQRQAHGSDDPAVMAPVKHGESRLISRLRAGYELIVLKLTHNTGSVQVAGAQMRQ
jgi:hypothetical protein